MRTNREWIEQTLRHEESEAVPYNFAFLPTALRRAEEHYGKDIEERLSLPIRMNKPKSIKPPFPDPSEYGDSIKDEFGVNWSTSAIDRGAPIGPCLPEPSLSGYTFPDVNRPGRFDHLGNWCREQEGNYRILWVGDLLERATFMRGMENLLMDVALETAFLEELLDNLTDYILQTMEVLFARCEFEAVAVSDDYGTQRSMIISPRDWRKFIKPCLARIYGLAKKNDRAVFHHSCGNFIPVIGDMIDLGLDILHPIQPEAMDGVVLKREFGRQISFCGGVSTQGLLVQGTPDQIRAEVRRLKREMGGGGGYVLDTGITIQDDVPVENMVAMIDEARGVGL